MITANIHMNDTPVTVANFRELLEKRVAAFEGCPLTEDTKAQIYQSVHQLCIALLHSMDWVPGDIADFWSIKINQLDETRLELELMPKVLVDKNIEYKADSDAPGVTLCYDQLEITAASPIAAQIALAQMLMVRQQMRGPSAW